MTSNIQIISDLRLAMEMDHALELMVTFKGMPVICKARVAQIVGEYVVFLTTDPGLARISHEKKITILGSEYFEPSTADVVRVDVAAGQVELCRFSYLGTRLGERMMMRVEPREPVRVVLTSETLSLAGDLADLSLNGIGVCIEPSDYDLTLKPGLAIRASFDLPGEHIEIECVVISALTTDDVHRLALRFTQGGPQKAAIFRYLIDRRNEIENELMAEYTSARSASR